VWKRKNVNGLHETLRGTLRGAFDLAPSISIKPCPVQETPCAHLARNLAHPLQVLARNLRAAELTAPCAASFS